MSSVRPEEFTDPTVSEGQRTSDHYRDSETSHDPGPSRTLRALKPQYWCVVRPFAIRSQGHRPREGSAQRSLGGQNEDAGCSTRSR